MTTVLVVDDDPALQRVLRLALRGLHYDVVAAMTGSAGLSEAALHSPDVIVLDLGLPDMDGVDVCRRIREWTETPIIVLSADATEDRKVRALDLGADDYVTKPFSMPELEARLRVALRRRQSAETRPAVLTSGPLEVDVVRHEVRMNGVPVELTKKEFQILAYLAEHPGKVITHRTLLDAVWGPGFGASPRYLREYAYRLRRKLGDDEGRLIVSRPGIGYQLVPQGAGGSRSVG